LEPIFEYGVCKITGLILPPRAGTFIGAIGNDCAVSLWLGRKCSALSLP